MEGVEPRAQGSAPQFHRYCGGSSKYCRLAAFKHPLGLSFQVPACLSLWLPGPLPKPPPLALSFCRGASRARCRELLGILRPLHLQFFLRRTKLFTWFQ